MPIAVSMRDGRTIYVIAKRGWLAHLVQQAPFHEKQSIPVSRGIWNPATGEYVWTHGLRIRYIAKGSIASVEEARDNPLCAPALTDGVPVA